MADLQTPRFSAKRPGFISSMKSQNTGRNPRAYVWGNPFELGQGKRFIRWPEEPIVGGEQ